MSDFFSLALAVMSAVFAYGALSTSIRTGSMIEAMRQELREKESNS